jgi:hypothetical protein
MQSDIILFARNVLSFFVLLIIANLLYIHVYVCLPLFAPITSAKLEDFAAEVGKTVFPVVTLNTLFMKVAEKALTCFLQEAHVVLAVGWSF